MKNSREYGQRITKLFRSARQKGGAPKPPSCNDPVEALVQAVLGEHVRQSEASALWSRVHGHFVDLNDLRVSRAEEIMEALGLHNEAGRHMATALPQALDWIFQKYDMVSLSSLLEEGKRQARKELEAIARTTRFVVNYCFLVGLGGHAIPLTAGMKDYLRHNALVQPEATDEDIEGFLERQVGASEAFEFYWLLRRESEAAKKKPSAPSRNDKAAGGAAAAGKRAAKSSGEGKGERRRTS